MYKYFGIFAAFVLVDCAVVPTAKVGPAVGTVLEPVAILSQHSDSSPDGSFNYGFEAADGTKVEQVAEIKTIDKDTVAEDVHGSVTYVDPEGKTHSLQYTANEQGYFPKGDDIFPEIASHLSYLEAHPQPINVDGKTVK